MLKAFGYRVLALFVAPGKAFLPPLTPSLWVLPFLVIAATDLTASFLLSDLYLEAQRAFAENLPIADADRELLLEQVERGRTRDFTPGVVLQFALGTIANTILLYVIPALVLYLGLTFGLGQRARFGHVLIVMLLSGMVLVLRKWTLTPLMLAQGTLDVYASPAVVLSREHGVAFQVANVLDLFHLFRMYLIVIGLTVVSRVTPMGAAGLVLGLWAVWSAIWIAIKSTPLGPALPAVVP